MTDPAGITVLVADDDPDYRLVVRLGLDGVPGFAPVLEAASAAEAVAIARRTPLDVVLLDLGLPGAFDATTELARGTGTKVVLVSTRSPDELAAVTSATDAVGYLGKDLSPSDLPAAVADLTNTVDRVDTVLAKALGRLPADTWSAGEARRMVRQTVEGWCGEDRLDDVALCVSELVTNAVVHAGSEPRVLVHVRPAVIHVEISDDSDIVPVPKGAAPTDTSGRGVSIMEALADRWGTRRRSGGGKTVWLDFNRVEAPVTERSP